MLSSITKGVVALSFAISALRPQGVEFVEGKRQLEFYRESPVRKEKMKLTPVEPENLWSVLIEAHHNVKNERPGEGLLVGAWAHVMLENAHGRRVWNNNIGNVGNLPSDPQGKYYSHFGKAKYRSFESIVGGAEAYWYMLYRCHAAVRNFEMRMPEAAALSLKRCNYYSSNEENYSQVLTTLYARGSRISKSRKGPE